MGLCDREVSATQFAILTSVSSIGGRVFGFAAAALGAISWAWLWTATALVAIPALALVALLPAAAEENPQRAR